MSSLVLQIPVLSTAVFANTLDQNQKELELTPLHLAQVGTIQAIRLPQRILSSSQFRVDFVLAWRLRQGNYIPFNRNNEGITYVTDLLPND